jgi:translation elongation factor EF-G
MCLLKSTRVLTGGVDGFGWCAPHSTLTKQMGVKVGIPDEDARNAKVTELFVYDNFVRTSVDEVSAGDICAFSGIPDIGIGQVGAPKTIATRTEQVLLRLRRGPFTCFESLGGIRALSLRAS